MGKERRDEPTGLPPKEMNQIYGLVKNQAFRSDTANNPPRGIEKEQGMLYNAKREDQVLVGLLPRGYLVVWI